MQSERKHFMTVNTQKEMLEIINKLSSLKVSEIKMEFVNGVYVIEWRT